jgi:DNA polymerase I
VPLSRETLEAIRDGELLIHNASFDLRWFGRHFGFIPRNVFCTLTADRLLLPSKKIKHRLADVLERRMDIRVDKEIDHKAWGVNELSERQLEYARIDVEHLHTLVKILSAELEAADLGRIFAMERELLPIITKMELHGFAISTEQMEKIRDREIGVAGNLEREIKAEFNDQELNVNAPGQLLEAFKKAGVELKSTAEESLIRTKHPMGAKVLEYRKSTKLCSAVESLLAKARNGRLHSSFNPLGAIHGRFSSSDPNLQNVHRGELRTCFIPSRIENVLISADYSQIELRVAALIAKDETMIEALRRGEDLHAKIAAVNLRCDQSAVTGEQRTTIGKASNFGFVYGQGAKGFQTYARTRWGAELSLDQATAYRFAYFNLYQGIRRWHNECWNKAKYSDVKEARTVWGRRLYPDVESEWGRFNMHTEYVVSGSCADLIKLAMLRVSKARLPFGAKMVATVHDELVFDVPAATAEESKRIIVEEMTAAFVEMFGTEIPVEVEAKVCANWGACMINVVHATRGEAEGP